MEITLRARKEMRSCYGESRIERIKSPLSLAEGERERVNKVDRSEMEDSIGHGRAAETPNYLLTLNVAICLSRHRISMII